MGLLLLQGQRTLSHFCPFGRDVFWDIQNMFSSIYDEITIFI
jgi:hypothetical protein